MIYRITCKTILLICINSTLLSCASIGGFPERTDDVNSQLKDLQGKYFHPGGSATGGKIDMYNSSTDPVERKKLRNEIILNRLLAYDLQFSLFQEALYKEGIVSNLSLDILGMGVGIAGGVVTQATTSRILSALSGGISGSRTAINKNLYYERTLPALLALMIANREKIKIEIYTGSQQEDAVYPLGQAISDLERYFIAGSIPGAIASVNEEAGKKQAQATIEFKAVRDKEYVDTATQKRIDKLLDAIEKLESGKALDLLRNPPTKISTATEALITASRGNVAIDALPNERAKTILKRVIVLSERTETELQAWEAAVIAEYHKK